MSLCGIHISGRNPAIQVIFAVIFLLGCSAGKDTRSGDAIRPGEKIVYRIRPAGTAVFQDQGITEFDGKPVRLVLFRTEVLGFSDTEKIYSDLKTMLPVRVEREISFWIKKEKIIESYDQEDYTLTITKYRGDRKVSEHAIEKTGPVHNAVLLLFLLRQEDEFPSGWEMPVRLLQDFTLQYEGTETITAGEQEFEAYHFRSSGDTFETWISADERRIPLKVRGLGALRYSLEMEEYFVE